MNFGIAAFPSKKLQDIVNSYRKRYDPHYSLIPPHMTLKSPFEVEEKEIEKVVVKLKEMAASSSAFPLEILKVSTFQPVNNVIYLKVAPNEAIGKLHQKIVEIIPEGQTDLPYIPHITLAQKLSNDEHSDVLGQVSLLNLRHEETIDRFHLLYQLEDGSWTVYETFHLA